MFQVEQDDNANYLLQFFATFADQLPVDAELKDIGELGRVAYQHLLVVVVVVVVVVHRSVFCDGLLT